MKTMHHLVRTGPDPRPDPTATRAHLDQVRHRLQGMDAVLLNDLPADQLDDEEAVDLLHAEQSRCSLLHQLITEAQS